jgi:hypothetical protein
MRTLILAVVLLLAPGAFAEAEPRLTLSTYQIHAGEVMTLRASGFAPNVKVVSHLYRPDGSEYPVMTFTTDVRGEVTHAITIVPIAFGTYEVRFVEEVTTVAASTRFVMVAPGWPAPGETSQTATVPEALVGVWAGNVVEASSGSASPALVALTGGPVGTVVGTVAYPARECGGELWLIGAPDASVQLGEVISYGVERCTGDGIIALTVPKDGRASFTWRDAGRQDAVAGATGSLSMRSDH